MTTPKDRAELLDLLVKADATASVYSTHIQQEESRLATLKAAGLAVVPVRATEEMDEAGLDDPDAAYCDRCMQAGHTRNAGWPSTVYNAMLAASPYREE